MTPAIAKAIYVLLAVGWYVIRYPYARRARRTPVIRSARGAREIALLLISLTGLGILPFLYVATGFPRICRLSVPADAGLAWFAGGDCRLCHVLRHPSRAWPQLVGQPRCAHRIIG